MHWKLLKPFQRYQTDGKHYLRAVLSYKITQSIVVFVAQILHWIYENFTCNFCFLFSRRNDFISVVRDAARTALEKMDVPEAQEVLKVTRVLEEEIKHLEGKIVQV